MPLYSYECATCNEIRDEFRSVAERNNAPECCGTPMKKLIGGYRVVADLEPYYDENLQTYVKSKRHRREVMREQGVGESYGKGWK